ncbi:PH domain-containing protein [Clostridium sp. P21]|uniref:PH domain-containing protein n=1 Tax=Clostridium muellerianum TaxID=2716538 RepID=A0A7Y0EJM9_9CLOT|nr:PH domain-containing protein [Clostridium muellerianum]NMM63655.1 PH domain-containing protein [Clostridium muellerianum]
MEQEHKISRDAVKVFRIKEFIWVVVITLIFIAFLKFLPHFKFKNIVSGIFIAVIVLSFISALIFPKVEYKNWSYYMEKDKVVLKYGVFVIETVVIPIKRIQYVDTSTGPILSRFGLTNLAIYTAGGKYEIPSLVNDIAKELQSVITSSVVRSLNEDEV